jgi:sugar O-acyltransferase (sialic acid O-acetyltransferase NeuD family)
VYGSGGHGREVAALVQDVVAAGADWELLGFVDDGRPAGARILDLPVLGGRDWLRDRSTPIDVVLGVGPPATKWAIVDRLRSAPVRYPTIVHPSVAVSKHVTVDDGCVILAGCVLTVDIRLAKFVTVNRMCTISHDCRVDDFATLAPGVLRAGASHVGRGCDLGVGTAAIPSVRIGEWTVVGAGATVTKNLPPNCTAVGVPARVISERPAEWYRDQTE